ncbi:response regulator transcription factor [Shewanella sp. Isolate11]|uniref:response regulator transcription factor n=1 Tax=Shewanella sp. Isolate11 TaxID=2908530 RepID=UPI001EFED33E|nr:response regulator transcription factor [Shewanella sp. Isolate11]MCG9696095.1 response regulator transcription factor [Shewanella sp. Isolate11]
MNKQLTVLVVDDHPLVCTALQLLLEKETYIAKVICAGNYQEALQQYQSTNPNFIIVDADLGCTTGNGFQLFTQLKKLNFQGHSLCISANDNPLLSEAALKIGMSGFIDKNQHTSSVSRAIQTIMCGYNFFKLNKENSFLSKRESEIASMLINGLKNKDIALNLSISPKTVSTYKTRILTKYNVNNIIELTSFKAITD